MQTVGSKPANTWVSRTEQEEEDKVGEKRQKKMREQPGVDRVKEVGILRNIWALPPYSYAFSLRRLVGLHGNSKERPGYGRFHLVLTSSLRTLRCCSRGLEIRRR